MLKNANLPQTWMLSYVVDIALSVTHLGKVIRGHFYLVLGILNFAFKYGPDRIEQKQLKDRLKDKGGILEQCRSNK